MYQEVSFDNYKELNDIYSDEDHYTYTIDSNKQNNPFDKAKEYYILFALQLIKYYQEIKRISVDLRYLISRIFRTKEYKKIEIDSTLLFLGLFFDIVLSDISIFSTFGIAYKGLIHYQNTNAQAKILLEHLEELQNENKKFAIAWQEKWRAISSQIEPCANILYLIPLLHFINSIDVMLEPIIFCRRSIMEIINQHLLLQL